MFTGFAYVAEAMAIILACKRLIYAYQGKFDSHIGQHVQTYLMLMAQVVLAHSAVQSPSVHVASLSQSHTLGVPFKGGRAVWTDRQGLRRPPGAWKTC